MKQGCKILGSLFLLLTLTACAGAPLAPWHDEPGIALGAPVDHVEHARFEWTEENNSPVVVELSRGAEQREWQIQLAPDGTALKDTQAASVWMGKLISSLRRLQENPLPAPERFSFRQAVELRLRNGARYRLELGDASTAPPGRWIRVNARKPELATGAALGLLESCKSWVSCLRYAKLSSRLLDDFNVVDLRVHGETVFSAQRLGAQWADTRQRKLKNSAEFRSKTETLFYAQSTGFFQADPPKEPALLELILRGRKAVPLRLVLRGSPEGSTSTVALWSSDRPEIWQEFDSSLIDSFPMARQKVLDLLQSEHESRKADLHQRASRVFR
jgi:hypothetical protein